MQKTNAKDIAEYVASIWLVVLISTNIIVILKKLGFSPVGLISFRQYAIILFTPLILLIYLFFLRGKRYLQIVEQYANETKQQRMRGHLILIAYIVATFSALILL